MGKNDGGERVLEDERERERGEGIRCKVYYIPALYLYDFGLRTRIRL